MDNFHVLRFRAPLLILSSVRQATERLSAELIA
jgi:hypothetical protein